MSGRFLLLFLHITLFSFNATVIDSTTLKPIKGAFVSDTKQDIITDNNGSFSIKTSDDTVHIKSYGYRPFSVKTDTNETLLKLSPINVKALYLTFWGANNNSKTLKNLLKIVDNTEINAVVVDVKNEYGSTVFLTDFKQANSYGAHLKRTNRDIKKFIQIMKEHNIYTIARIVTFKDELQASHNTDYAIKKIKTGKIWRNSDNMAWVDPFDIRSHKYTIEIAKESAKVGFDEINFDYVRFPAKSGLDFKKENTQKNRIEAIASFLELAKKELRPYGVFISADTYGNVCWSKNDNNIGQTIQSLAKHVDYLAPMLYPSGFASGSFNVNHPAKHPYIVIYRSIKHIEKIIPPKRIRPWLQNFRDYNKQRVHYKKYEITQQIKASKDMKTNGYMMWSPSSKYVLDYFK